MRFFVTGQLRRRGAVSTLIGGLALAFALGGCGGFTGTGGSGPPAVGLDRSVPASIPSDCSRDVTPNLLAWIGSVPDGSVLQFARNGCYRIDGTLRIEGRNNLTFEGNGATFKPLTDGTELGPRAARARAVFFFVTGSNITLQNLTVRGAFGLGLNQIGYSLEAQHAFVVGQTVAFHLKNVNAYDVYGDFVYVGPYTRNVLVEHSVFDRSGRQGWDVAGGSNITFDSNYISNVAHATIDLEPANTGDVDGLTISNNTIQAGRLMFFSIGGVPVRMNNFRILNNLLVNKPLKIQANVQGTMTNLTISGNRSEGSDYDTGVDQSGGGAFFINNATNVVVTNNQAVMTWGRNTTGVNLGNSHNVVVTDNVWRGGSGSVSYWDNLNSNVCWSRNVAYSPPSPEAGSGGAC